LTDAVQYLHELSLVLVYDSRSLTFMLYISYTLPVLINAIFCNYSGLFSLAASGGRVGRRSGDTPPRGLAGPLEPC